MEDRIFFKVPEGEKIRTSIPKTVPPRMVPENFNFKFRIVEKTNPINGTKKFYPERKAFGLFWVAIRAITIEGHWISHRDTKGLAINAIEAYKAHNSKTKNVIHYL